MNKFFFRLNRVCETALKRSVARWTGAGVQGGVKYKLGWREAISSVERASRWSNPWRLVGEGFLGSEVVRILLQNKRSNDDTQNTALYWSLFNSGFKMRFQAKSLRALLL